MRTSKGNFWLSTNGLAAIGLFAAVLYFLLAEHRAQFLMALPYLMLLLCPLLHVFMHGGHGHGGHGHGDHSEAHEHRREEER